MKYFKNITTAEELKKQFRTLCQTMHPDKGGNADEFKAMLKEYENALKNVGAWTKDEADHVAGVRRGASVVFFGAGMTETHYIITAVNGDRVELVRLFSHDFKSLEDVEFFDKDDDRTSRRTCDRYSRVEPLSKKFGIGYYWDDIEGKTYTESEINEAERVANNFDRWIKIKEENEKEEARRAQEEADRIEAGIIAEWSKILEQLPPLHKVTPWAEICDLSRDERKKIMDADRKAERKANASRLAAFKRNVKAMFAHFFPGVKVSVSDTSKTWCESSVISWVDGPSVAEVESVKEFDYFRASSWVAAGPYDDYGHRESRKSLRKFREMFGAFSDESIKFNRTFSEQMRPIVDAAIIDIIPDFKGKKFNDKVETTDEQAQKLIKLFGFAFYEPYNPDASEEEHKARYKRENEHREERDRIRRVIAPTFQRWAGECYWQSINELFTSYYKIAEKSEPTANEPQATASEANEGETLAEGDGVQVVATDKGAKLTGNTYAHKAEIKAMGARWWRGGQCWTISADKVAEAVALVNSWNDDQNANEPTADEPTTAQTSEDLNTPNEPTATADQATAEAVATFAATLYDICANIAKAVKEAQEQAEKTASEAKATATPDEPTEAPNEPTTATAEQVATLRNNIATLSAQLATMSDQLRKMSDRLAELTADSENEPTEPTAPDGGGKAPTDDTLHDAEEISETANGLHPEEVEALRHDFARAAQRFKYAEDRNEHTQAVIICGNALLYRYNEKTRGTVCALLDELREIKRDHEKRGHLLPEEFDRRYFIMRQFIRLTVEQYGEDLAAVLWGAGTVSHEMSKAD